MNLIHCVFNTILAPFLTMGHPVTGVFLSPRLAVHIQTICFFHPWKNSMQSATDAHASQTDLLAA